MAKRALLVAAVLAVLPLLPPAGVAATATEAAVWLDRMAVALERLDYSGTLVELEGESVSAMRVVHRYAGGVATERLTGLDAVGRELIRRGDEVTAILPDQQAVVTDRRIAAPGASNPLHQQFSSGLDVPAAHYRLDAEAGAVLLDRATVLITIQPADALRYGYRLWLDQATALPLKVEVIGGGNAVLEQVAFADLRLGDGVGAADFATAPTPRGYARRGPTSGATPAAAAGWAVTRLPPGFALRTVETKPGLRGGDLTQFVYSDGVATVSVFVEPDTGAAAEPAAARVGADSVHTRQVAGHRVTAVGEVPSGTVAMIAGAMRPLAAGR